MLWIGQCKDPVSVLRLEQKGNDWEWKEAAHTWAKAERQAKTNLFSRVGMGQKSVRFTMRKRSLSLHDAIRWQGKHCFLTEIKEIEPDVLGNHGCADRAGDLLRNEYPADLGQIQPTGASGGKGGFLPWLLNGKIPGFCTKRGFRGNRNHLCPGNAQGDRLKAWGFGAGGGGFL